MRYFWNFNISSEEKSKISPKINIAAKIRLTLIYPNLPRHIFAREDVAPSPKYWSGMIEVNKIMHNKAYLIFKRFVFITQVEENVCQLMTSHF